MIIPILHVVAYSFSNEAAALQSKFILFPSQFTLNAYSFIFSTPTFFQSIQVSVIITVVGTALKMLITFMFAFMLAHKDLPGRAFINYAIVFTLVFGAGMIPNFLTVVGYGLRNTLWALIVPGLIDSFNLIIIRTFIQNIPMELEESAKLDGCNEVRILFSIIMPLSMASIATFSLFYAVGLWNSYMNAVLYIDDTTKYPIQVLLRQIILMSSGIGDRTSFDDTFFVPPKTVRMAVITASTLPILLVYPFVQKHFTKGVMLGSVKG
jgi:putative aldouronate transport system permease protein